MFDKIKYFVVIEIDLTGYLIGSYESFELAEVEFEKLVSLSSKYNFSDSEKMNENFVNFRKYHINNDQFINGNEKTMISNGIVSIYIYEIDKKWSSVELFIKNREFQNKLFLNE